MVIDFSGTAGQVRTAFHTEIHNLVVNGKNHIANISDPQIPAALAAVVGIVSLHDFRPKSQYTLLGPPCPIFSPQCYPVVPADLATIYNFNPLFKLGLTGSGQAITVVEDADLYSYNDWKTFRSKFGLSGYTGGSLTTVHPSPASGTNNCTDPGYDNYAETTLDAEWASAAAPDALIVVASCKDTATFGFIIAAENLINQESPPAIISMSYGECERANGTSANAAINSAYQQGVAEGVSIFIAAGDQDADVCDSNVPATQGLNVNAYASTPYNVAVGGTDFLDTYRGENSTYWNSTNTSTYGSAKSYIPEMAWNDSCGSQLLAKWLRFSTTYGSSGLCNSPVARVLDTIFGFGLLTDAGGSGGPSSCAQAVPLLEGQPPVCIAGWPKPSWQSGVVGIPKDGVRDLPDVSMFAGWLSPWGHAYVFCWSNGYSCSGAPSTWPMASGTSFAAPIVAGIQALVNQNWGSPQGNPNYAYYRLAATEYGKSGSKDCNSSRGNKVASTCIFYDVTAGDNDAPCTGTENCYRPSGKYGVLSTSDSAYDPAYTATTGYDLATGLGTINAYNLVVNWPFFVPCCGN